MALPTVSVIIPTYNRGHLVTRAIESALRETDENDEIIVIDDGSEDNTEQVLKPFTDRITYRKIVNRGGGGARNVGVDMATKELVAYLDSDDEWFEGKLFIQKQLMANRPEILFCFSDISITTRDGRKIPNFLINWHRDHRNWEEILGPGQHFSEIGELPPTFKDFKVHTGSIYAQTAFGIYTVTSTTVVRRIEAGDAIYHADDIPFYEDWLGFGQLARKGTAGFLDVDTAWQHSHSGPRITDAGALTSSTTRMIILDRLWGQDPEFMEQYGDRFHALYQEQLTLKAKSLIALGKVRESKEFLAKVENPPVLLKVLSSLPSLLVKLLMGLRRIVRKLTGRGD